ncbi:MAG: SlyX family protein [Neisseria sp.]|nr:SlyX family protein [Neisseria sp.]
MEELEQRIAELEIQAAMQDELLQSLNDTVARLNETLALQQGQLRLLYSRLQDRAAVSDGTDPSEEVPPHY